MIPELGILEVRMITWRDQDRCVHHLVELQAACTPEAVAVVFGNKHLTYGELDQEANKLAHYLRGLGANSETRIGLFLERGLKTVVGLIGILKAGGVFVPLDPNYPQERLSFMLADAQVSILVTQEHLSASLPRYEGQIIRLDTDWPSIAETQATSLDSGVTLTNLAYMIYTSGSTGQPKAVMVEHGNLIHFLSACQMLFAFTSDDTIVCLNSVAFDIALFELLSPLLVGGTTVILSQDEIWDPYQLVRKLDRITCLHAVPSLMRQIVDEVMGTDLGAASCKTITEVSTGGDTIPPQLIVDMRAAFPSARVRVNYGPTESTIFCTSHTVAPTEQVDAYLIGEPIPNTIVKLFDKYQRQVPIGARGEIYVGGAGVTRGYWDREELTRERYVTIDNQRYYRTGDLGRWRPDGTIEFLGRVDNQVKIRGYRIELGEIEVVLAQHTDVREAVVLVHETESDDGQLVAYAVPQQRRTVSPNDLSTYLHKRLPQYMVPSFYFVLDSLPLTPNGKIDRQALLALNMVHPSKSGISHETPYTPVEREMVKIWSAILPTGQVDINDNFFSLGGHSLLAAKLLHQMQTIFHVKLSMRQLFETPTVSGLALLVQQELDEQASRAGDILVINEAKSSSLQ